MTVSALRVSILELCRHCADIGENRPLAPSIHRGFPGSSRGDPCSDPIGRRSSFLAASLFQIYARHPKRS